MAVKDGAGCPEWEVEPNACLTAQMHPFQFADVEIQVGWQIHDKIDNVKIMLCTIDHFA